MTAPKETQKMEDSNMQPTLTGNGRASGHSLPRLVGEEIVDVIRHALGGEASYRNYYMAGEDSKKWEHLQAAVELGLMVRIKVPEWTCGDYIFQVTKEGKAFFFANAK